MHLYGAHMTRLQCHLYIIGEHSTTRRTYYSSNSVVRLKAYLKEIYNLLAVKELKMFHKMLKSSFKYKNVHIYT